jgi:hypothetical protein
VAAVVQVLSLVQTLAAQLDQVAVALVDKVTVTAVAAIWDLPMDQQEEKTLVAVAAVQVVTAAAQDKIKLAVQEVEVL